VADTSALGDRMKGYEAAARWVLPGRTYTIIRVDGRAFHSLLRHAEKPFDHDFIAVMDEVAAALCKEVSGTVFSYQQSDEISLLVTDFGSVHTEAWFGGIVQKMAFGRWCPVPSRRRSVGRPSASPLRGSISDSSSPRCFPLH
jgi:tRNA(His) guanylyltransferase